ncbi:hypothetical protein PO124_03005 [Bacillus licheniformis]|nr:hypothetical protein [Bacillus licheniformis]
MVRSYALREGRLCLSNPELQFIRDTVFDEIAFGARQRSWPEEQVERKRLNCCRNSDLMVIKSASLYIKPWAETAFKRCDDALFDQDLLLLDEPTFGQDERRQRIDQALKGAAGTGNDDCDGDA